MTFSRAMFDWTERPGVLLPLDTRQIIAHRYTEAAIRAAGKRVLEIGSGSGIGIRSLYRVTRYIAGCEISAENLRGATTERCRVVRGDAHRLPFRAASFEVVLALAMVYYLRMEPFLSEVRRVLEPGGRLFFCMSNKDIPGFVPAEHTVRYYSVPEMAALLEANGFAPSFSGAFPAPVHSLFVLRLRALLKNCAKSMITSVPGGDARWEAWRLRTLGELAPLPSELHIGSAQEPCVPVPADARDRRHRVIYIDAALR